MNLKSIKNLVGESITKENLTFVDSFVYKWLGVFIPIGGNCGYAITSSHTHPSYMFVVSYDDQSSIFVGDKKFQSSPDSIFCLSPNIPHHEIQDYIPPKYCAIFIDAIRFQKILNIYLDEIPNFDTKIINIKDSKIEYYLKIFINESYNPHHSKSSVLENIALLLTHEIIRTIFGMTIDSDTITKNPKINEVLQYINANYDKEITLDDLSRIATISKSHLLKLFGASMQMSPIAYLTKVRLQNSKKMLLSGKLRITTIARQCGFTSPSYFTKIFKNAYQETPKEFQQRDK